MSDTEILGLMFGLLGGMVTAMSGWSWYKPHRQLTPSSHKRNLKWFARVSSVGTLIFHGMFVVIGHSKDGRLDETFLDVYILSCYLGAIVGLLLMMVETYQEDKQNLRRSTYAY